MLKAHQCRTDAPTIDTTDSEWETLSIALVQMWTNSMHLEGEGPGSPETPELARRRHRQQCRILDGASWRWVQAQREAARTGGPRQNGDKMCRWITRFLFVEAGGQVANDTIADQFRDWSHAFRQARLLYGNPIDRLIVETLVLAGMPVTEIATRTGINSDVLAIYEAAFFDAREILGARKAIICYVIDFGSNADKDPMRSELLRASYFGGRIVALGLVDYLRHYQEDHDLTTESGLQRRQFELMVQSRQQMIMRPLPNGNATAALLRSASKEWLTLPTVADLVQRRLYRCDIALPPNADKLSGSTDSHAFVAAADTAKKSA